MPELAKAVRAGSAATLRASSPAPSPSRRSWRFDIAITITLAAGVLIGAAQPGGEGMSPAAGRRLGPVMADGPAHPAWYLIAAALTALPLAVRRRYPLTAFWAVIGATVLYHALAGNDPKAVFATCLIAAYSAAAYGPRRVLVGASLVVAAGLASDLLNSTLPNIPRGFAPFVLVLPIALAANAIRTWKLRAAASHKRLTALHAEQHEATRRAVEMERSRIARELHDVVTHNVSMMVVQAGAARRVLGATPDQARDALLAVEAGGRAAMAELRHVMGLLTMTSDGPNPNTTTDLAPQPGLDQLTVLVCRVRDTGVSVELTVTGTPTPVPAGVGLAAYRVVQEGLTNAVKHAAGARVQVTVDYSPRAVRVEVADSGGTPATTTGPGNGRGLIGLRERVAVYGGTLHAGMRPIGGYRLAAVIPSEEQ